MSITQLSLTQEKLILEYLQEKTNDLFIASGSSRAVFEIDDTIQSLLGFKTPVSCVLKMSLGLGGYRQSRREVATFEQLQSFGVLAEVFGRGSIFTVMEQVDTDERDFYEFYSYDCCVEDYLDRNAYSDDDDGEREYLRDCDVFEEAAYVIRVLDSELGDTSDNSQLGRTDDGRLVAYDYGFISGVYCRDQMTRTSDYFSYGKKETNLFFELLINTVEETLALNGTSIGEAEFNDIEENYIDLIEGRDEECCE